MMKKFNDANIGVFALLSMCLSLYSCSKDNDNFPKDYVGFEETPKLWNVRAVKRKASYRLKLLQRTSPKKTGQYSFSFHLCQRDKQRL